MVMDGQLAQVCLPSRFLPELVSPVENSSPEVAELRERVAAAVDHGEGSQREIARRFRVSLSFIVRLLERRRDAGTLAPKPHGGGPNPALSPRDQQRLRELIEEQSDATLDQLKQQAGFTCTLTTIWRTLRRLGLTYKKKTLHASERNRPDVQEKRRRYQWYAFTGMLDTKVSPGLTLASPSQGPLDRAGARPPVRRLGVGSPVVDLVQQLLELERGMGIGRP